MLTIESYRDVLSENSGRGNVVRSAWAVVGLLGMMLVVFA